MVTGFAALFGGNLRTTSNSLTGQVKHGAGQRSAGFASTLQALASAVAPSQKPVAGAKKTAAAAASTIINSSSTTTSSPMNTPGSGSGGGNANGALAPVLMSFAAAAVAPTVNTNGYTSPGPGTQVSAAPPVSPGVGANTPTPAIMVLTTALAAAGVDISQIQLTEHVDTETYPGGSYTQDLITMTGPNGVTQTYGTNLMLMNPQITVTEIQHMLYGWPK